MTLQDMEQRLQNAQETWHQLTWLTAIIGLLDSHVQLRFATSRAVNVPTLV